MTTPRRIQFRRTRGWRKPDHAVVVARPTKWGNPYKIGPSRTAEQAVRAYESAIAGGAPSVPGIDEIRAELAGHDLACWCPITDASGAPVSCHADVLLRIANPDTTTSPGPSHAERRPA